MIIRHAHQSGHVTASAAQQAATGEEIARHSDVAGLTEALRAVAPAGWGMVGHECKILFDEALWDLTGHGTVSIPTPPWKRGKSRRTSVEIEWAKLTAPGSGFVLLRPIWHLPAHLFRTAQRRANAAALDGFAAALGPVVAKTQPDEVTGSGDNNLPLTSARTAARITDAVAPLGLRLVVPPKATRGLRTIDGFLTTARLHDVGMLAREPGFDHRGARMRTCACERVAK